MISTLLRWAAYVLFAVAAGIVGLSIWLAIRGGTWAGAASTAVSGFLPAVLGLALLGLAKMIDDVAATRALAERQAASPPPPHAD